MAFFDNIGRKVSEAGQKMIQKTGEMSDTSRLNAQIGDEEKKMNAAYLQIGKLYASLHRNDPEPEFAPFVQSVTSSEDTIRVCREQIQRIKGVRSCPKCGAEVSAASAFCALCGAPMPMENPTVSGDVLVCASCGTILEAGMRFCTNCGRPVAKAAPVVPPVTTESAPPAPDPIVPSSPVEPEVSEPEMAVGFSAPEAFGEPVAFAPAPVEKTSGSVDPETVAETPAEDVSTQAVPTDAEPAVAEAAEEVVTESAPAAHAQLTCPGCGAPIEPSDAFCMNCGTKL